MQAGQPYWDHIFAEPQDSKPDYDDWLLKHKGLLEASREIPILDLGCGAGGDTLCLTELGYRVIACDFSDVALSRVKMHIPSAEVRKVNLAELLPFEKNSAQVIVADLSLHYFSWEKTEAIFNELQRVLVPGGHLLCRVNSIQDVHFGAGEGSEIEPRFYEQNGQFKRFFNRDDLIRLLSNWQLEFIQEATMNRYHKPKKLWEFAAAKPK